MLPKFKIYNCLINQRRFFSHNFANFNRCRELPSGMSNFFKKQGTYSSQTWLMAEENGMWWQTDLRRVVLHHVPSVWLRACKNFSEPQCSQRQKYDNQNGNHLKGLTRHKWDTPGIKLFLVLVLIFLS